MSRKKTGCRSCMYAPQIDTAGVITFGTPKPIKDLEELSYSYVYAEGSNYADNVQNIYRKKPNAIDLGLTWSDIPLAIEAELQGKRYNAGGSSTNTADKASPVALLWQETYDDGSYINRIVYNATVYKVDDNSKTEGENIEFTAQSMAGRAIPFTNASVTGELDFKMDSADPTVDTAKLASFFTAVQYNEPTVDVVYTGYTEGAVTDISIVGVTFDVASKTFKNVPADATTFTFKLATVTTTATKSGTWTFA